MMVKDGLKVCHKRMRNHNKSQKALGSTGRGVDRPTIPQSVDICFSDVIVNYRNFFDKLYSDGV
jgi:hypothetical protein